MTEKPFEPGVVVVQILGFTRFLYYPDRASLRTFAASLAPTDEVFRPPHNVLYNLALANPTDTRRKVMPTTQCLYDAIREVTQPKTVEQRLEQLESQVRELGESK